MEFHDKEYDKILAIKSREGERIPLDAPVVATGGVEVWLNRLLNMARQSVNTVICNAVAAAREPEYEHIPFIESVPAQVCYRSRLSPNRTEREHAKVNLIARNPNLPGTDLTSRNRGRGCLLSGICVPSCLLIRVCYSWLPP